MLKNVHLSDKQKAELLRSYDNYLLDPPLSVEPVLAYLLANPKEPAEVKLAGLEVLSVNGALKGDKAGDWLLELLDNDDRSSIRLAVVKAIDDTHLTKAAPQLVKLFGNAERPLPERLAVVKAARQAERPQ